MSEYVMDGTSHSNKLTKSETLFDFLHDGIYLLFLIKNGNLPESTATFSSQVDRFLADFETRARQAQKPSDQIDVAKYAYSALLDETILSTNSVLRMHWERAPLQLRLFGEHLAGEGFFNKLEELRLNPNKNIEAIEVFYACLCLGFQGKFLLEGRERLMYLIDKVDKEISSVRGAKHEFSPNWQLPQRFDDFVRHKLPLWVYGATLACLLVVMFIGFKMATGNLIVEYQTPTHSEARK